MNIYLDIDLLPIAVVTLLPMSSLHRC